MRKVKIATENQHKIQTIVKTMEKFLDERILFEGFRSDSGVPEQPLDEQVIKGAENRISSLKQLIKATEYDYLISCEGGIINLYDNWFNVHIVIIEDKEGNRSTGISQGYPIPEKNIQEIQEQGLAKVLDKNFNGKGGMRILTNGMRKREHFIEEATLMAISGLESNKMW